MLWMDIGEKKFSIRWGGPGDVGTGQGSQSKAGVLLTKMRLATPHALWLASENKRGALWQARLTKRQQKKKKKKFRILFLTSSFLVALATLEFPLFFFLVVIFYPKGLFH